MHVPTGTYLRTNESAACIVELLSGGTEPSEVARRFAALNDISSAEAEAGVRSVLESLEKLRQASNRPLRRPRLRTAGRELARWWHLSPALRWAVLEVTGLLCVVELGLRTTNLRRLTWFARTPLADFDGPLPPRGDISRLRPGEQRRLWAIDWVDGRWLAPLTCLRRALVSGFVLRRRQPMLRLGITGAGSTAHAWIEAEGVGYGLEEVDGIFSSPE